MASYVVSGASRGIGLELTKQLLALPSSQVGTLFALTRSDPSSPLCELLSKNADRAVSVHASVDDTASVQKAAEEIKSKLDGKGLDVLVNNAGIQHITPGGTRVVAPEHMAEMLNTNLIGVHRMIAAFLPLLEAGTQKKIINISTTMGSIAWAPKFKLAPSPSYKIAKAALHMLNAQYALDLADAGFTCLCVSPGWLKTDLGGDIADFPVELGVTELKRIILETNKKQTGKFVNIHVPGQENAWGQYDGGEIPW